MSSPIPDKGVGPTAPPPYSEVVPPFVGAAPPGVNYPSGYPPPPAYQAAPGQPAQPYPPQGGFNPPQRPFTEQPTTVVYTPAALGSGPSRFFCPTCQREVLTNVTYESGLLTWILVALICILGGALGCCLIPFCCDCDKDVVHTCPHCKQTLGKHGRFGPLFCCLIPLCCPPCKDVEHICPICGRLLGSYQRL